MRRFLSLFPISRREADHAADIIESLSWAELINTTLISAMVMITLPALLLVLSVPGAWS